MGKESSIQWMGRSVRRIKQFCNKQNIEFYEYKNKVRSGLKWCTGCKMWHLLIEFKIDNSRFDGLSSMCHNKKNEIARNKYKPKPRPKKGRRFVNVRDKDEKQARRRVNYLVEQSIILHPNKLPCTDCGHIYVPGGKRHEYDHYLGYDAINHEKVQPVCSTCHKKRTNGNKN